MSKAFVSTRLCLVAGAALIPLMLSSCGGGSSASSSTTYGNVQVGVTDAPGSEFSHVWVTVEDIWFNTDGTAGPNDTSWHKFSLANPVTIDLANLSNGNLSTVFDGVSLPVGTYQQIRIFLAPTEAALTSSASQTSGANGTLQYNNEVEYTPSGTTSTTDAPLRVFNALQGIRIPGTFNVTGGKTLRLVLDFDIGHDIIAYTDAANATEFLLKPRLNYFDLDNAGAIKGQIDPTIFYSNSNTSGGYNFVIKAEVLNADGTRHVVARATTVDSNGNFVLYPLWVPAGSQTQNYDVLLRGRNVATYIVKNVPVTRGTTPTNNPTQLQPSAISMQTGSEFTANFAANAGSSPTGTWVNFYETLTGTGASEVPYEIRYRHVNPYTGIFSTPIELSTAQLYWGTYTGSAISFAATNPAEGVGNYDARANAFLYDQKDVGTVTSSSTTLPPVSLSITAPAVGDTVSGTITPPSSSCPLDTAYVVVSHDGVVVTTFNASSSFTNGTYNYQTPQIPGGSSATGIVLPGAFYTMQIYAWNSTSPGTCFAYGLSPVVDLRSGSASGVTLGLTRLL